jgi:small-conductance mechanosensitive channel
LGSSSAISNIVAGVVLTYMRPFKMGDRVKIADTMGDVIEKSLLITRIRTTKNVNITIPNSMVLASHIINYSSSAQDLGLILNTQVTIGYDTPWKKVHELLINAAKKTESILKNPAPFVLQISLNDFTITYEINAYTQDSNSMANLYSRLHENIQNEFNEAGVEILSPDYTVYRKDQKITPNTSPASLS